MSRLKSDWLLGGDGQLINTSRYEGVQCWECKCDLRDVLSRNRVSDMTGGILCGASRCPSYVCDGCYTAHVTLHQLKNDQLTSWYHAKRLRIIAKNESAKRAELTCGPEPSDNASE